MWGLGDLGKPWIVADVTCALNPANLDDFGNKKTKQMPLKLQTQL
jgi:hypothetical protein